MHSGESKDKSSGTSVPRGFFPGYEFFNQLTEIAKDTTERINAIEQELDHPSQAQGLQIRADWGALENRVNKAAHQAQTLKSKHFDKRFMLSDALNTIYNCYDWISKEADRIEYQMQQFGFDTNNCNDSNNSNNSSNSSDSSNPIIRDFSYDKPLTPALQAQLELEERKQLLLEQKIKQKFAQQHQNSTQNHTNENGESARNNNNSSNNNNNNNSNANATDANNMDPMNANDGRNDLHPNIRNVHNVGQNANQTRNNGNDKNRGQIGHKSSAMDQMDDTDGGNYKNYLHAEDANTAQMFEATEAALGMDAVRRVAREEPRGGGRNGRTTRDGSNLGSQEVTPLKLVTSTARTKPLPISPKTPKLEDFGLAKYGKHHKSKKSEGRALARSSKSTCSGVSVETRDSDTSRMTAGSLETGTKGDIGLAELLAKYGKGRSNKENEDMNDMNDMNGNGSSRRHSNASSGRKSRSSFESSYHNHSSVSVSALSPSDSRKDVSQDVLDDSQFERTQSRMNMLASKYSSMFASGGTGASLGAIEPVTPVTFTMQRLEHEREMRSKRSKRNDNANGGHQSQRIKVKLVSHISRNEFLRVPGWISGQFESIETVNRCIDNINDFLNKSDVRTITKTELKNLVENKKEKPLLLLLTQTKRLKSEWVEGDSVYSVIPQK